MQIKRFILTVLIVVVLTTGSDAISWKPVSAHAMQTWYVATTGSDENDCATIDSPCATIMGALNRPGFVDGDRVLVAEGVYRIGYDGNFDGITISKSVFVSGGWDENFANMAGETIIENVGRGFTINSGTSVSIRMFGIGSGSGVGIYNEGELSVNDVTVSAGSASGLYNEGSISIKNSKLSHSYGCGILNRGVIKLSDSQVIGNHGCGITSSGTMTIERSTIQGSTLRFGCTGVSNSGTMHISDSAILDNGLYYPNFGAGLCNWGETTLVNSTISGNEANADPGGGIYSDGPSLALYNTSLVHNHAGAGGGIYVQSGSVTLQNSLVAQNTADEDSQDCWGSLNSLGYNLLGDSLGCTFTGIMGDLLDITAQVFPAKPLYIYPKIGETPPSAPLARNSPAVEAGDPSGCKDENGRVLSTDQRGVGRVGRCDIGAYEFDPAYDPLHYLWLGLIHGPLP
jgi:hypothetical protein